jgi:hypothetical protein
MVQAQDMAVARPPQAMHRPVVGRCIAARPLSKISLKFGSGFPIKGLSSGKPSPSRDR